ncbi:MAG: EamA family transporter [Terracidiphilus sp.]
MADAGPQTSQPERKTASRASIVLAFASVYFFWGSTYTAIRIGAAQIPALLLSGTRFTIAGVLLLGVCAWRRLPLVSSWKTMAMLGAIGLLLLGGGNVGLVWAEKTLPSGLASLVLAVTPLFIALMEIFLPEGEPLPARGWLGMALGFAGLAALMWPSLSSGLSGDRTRLVAMAVLVAGGLSWALGSVVSRRARLPVNTLVAAAWQMVIAGAIATGIGTVLGQWRGFHANAAAIGSVAYLITGGSLAGYTCFIYLLEHVPVAKVSSYSYVNPVVAVLLGIVFLGERPYPAEFAGMAGVILAVFLLSSAQVKARPRARQELETLPEE